MVQRSQLGSECCATTNASKKRKGVLTEMDIDFSAVPENELQSLPEYIEDITGFGEFDSDDGWRLDDGTIVPLANREFLISFSYDGGLCSEEYDLCRTKISNTPDYFYYYDGSYYSGIVNVLGIGDGSPKTIIFMLDRYAKTCQPMLPSRVESHVAEISSILQIFGSWREIGLYADHVMSKNFDEHLAECKFECNIR